MPAMPTTANASSAQWLMLLCLLLPLGVIGVASILNKAPTWLPGQRQMGRIRDLLLPTDPAQRTLSRRFLVGAINCLAGVVALNYGASLGVIDAQACYWLTLSACIVITGFYAVFRSGLNLRLSDPSMAEAQMLFTVTFLAWGYAIGGPGRPVAVILMFVTLMFGMFTSTARQLVRVSVIAALAFGVVMWHVAREDHQTAYGPQLQLVYFIVLLVMLISVCLLVSQLVDLRNKAMKQQVALQNALERIQELATRDELTGLYNRRHMLTLLNTEKHRSNRAGRTFCVAMIDVDHFKRINDVFGHATGDQVLSGLAQAITSGLRETDVVARWGGEEFLVMFTDTECTTAEMVLSRIQQSLATLELCPAVPPLRVQFSAGVTAYQPDELLTRTIDRADRALYEAKAAGRNRVQLAA